MTYDETSHGNESSDRDTDLSSANQQSLKKLMRKRAGNVRAVLAGGDLVMIGRRVQRLRGEASVQVRALLKL